ncbi:hypothetical protein N431DRAFT_484295 [Stipitochalara longipes BDJ]|nr:hypothetical protein N431DRAFT_484295 [Stipitochalara longipes BDJ]
MSHPNSATVPEPDQADIDKAEEERYTTKFLDGPPNFPLDMKDELIDPFSQFYLENKQAGYAFYMLGRIFKKIDAFIGIKSATRSTQSPWVYFSSLESLVGFGTAIEELTKAAAEGASEPPEIQKIRIADRKNVRRAMLKRLITLEPSRRTFNAEILENLKNRNAIFDDFLKGVYKRRAKKQDSPATGLLRRKPKKIASAVKSRSATETTEARESVPNTKQPVNFGERIRRLFQIFKSPLQESNRKCIRDFTGRTSTVLTLSVICLMATTGFACLALFLSLYNPVQSKTIDADFFTLLQQIILLFFSQYALIIPYLRGMELSTERFWFLATLMISTLTGVASIFAYFWMPPVSTFLGFVANAAQIIATLLLIQEASFQRPAVLVSKGES